MYAIKRALTTFFIQNKKVSTFSLTFLWGYLLYMVSGESAVDILLITVGRQGAVVLKDVEMGALFGGCLVGEGGMFFRG